MLQLLPCFVGSLTLGEITYHFLRPSYNPLERFTWQGTKASCQDLARAWDFLPLTLWVGHFGNGYPQAPCSLQITAILASFFTVTLRQTLSQNHSGKLFLDLWCTKTEWEHRCVLLSCCCCSVTESCPSLSDPMDCSHQAPLSIGFPRREYWSGLPFLIVLSCCIWVTCLHSNRYLIQ